MHTGRTAAVRGEHSTVIPEPARHIHETPAITAHQTQPTKRQTRQQSRRDKPQSDQIQEMDFLHQNAENPMLSLKERQILRTMRESDKIRLQGQAQNQKPAREPMHETSEINGLYVGRCL